MLIADNPYNDWYIGLAVGFAVVVVVVVLVAVILTLAERIGTQAGHAVDGVEAVVLGTTPLWEVRQTNAAAAGILQGARTAREIAVARLTGSGLAPAAAPSPAAPQPPPLPEPDLPSAPGRGSPAAPPPSPPGVLGPDAYPNRGRGA